MGYNVGLCMDGFDSLVRGTKNNESEYHHRRPRQETPDGESVGKRADGVLPLISLTLGR